MSFTFNAVNSVKYNSAASNRINQHIFLGYICMINTSGSSNLKMVFSIWNGV